MRFNRIDHLPNAPSGVDKKACRRFTSLDKHSARQLAMYMQQDKRYETKNEGLVTKASVFFIIFNYFTIYITDFFL